MPASPDLMVAVDPKVVLKWVEGWALSRSVAGPVAVPGGLRVEVGLPDQVRRFVFPLLNAGAIRDVAQRETEPYTYLKICAPAESVAPLLPARWTILDPGFMMRKSFGAGMEPLPMPEGYRLALRREGPVIFAEIFGADGQEAAHGRVVLNGTFAIVDRIATDPAHRRPRLGSIVVQHLERVATATGAEMGILVATPSGFGLYSTLDWALYSPYTSAAVLPPAG
ncbi:GNAT family N-acetyltransferase [Microvirga rosea]|uniref:hypothetical protein n=1 Tax=Microvirga rosea TaxID=2715425 RepID=UPI001D0BCF02|nr:hypothetical protein [Microvirga rosea]MCB8821606.1 hypothetical protein [Microvirga rosea]